MAAKAMRQPQRPSQVNAEVGVVARAVLAAVAVAASQWASSQEEEGALMWGRGALLDNSSPPGWDGPAEELEVALPAAA